MRLTNNNNFSLSIAVFLATDWYDHNRWPGKPHMSATGLLRPTRINILSQRAAKKPGETKDISSYIPSRMGTAIHAGIEKAWIKGDVAANLQKLGYPKKVAERVRVNPSQEELEKNPEAIPVYLEQRHHKEFEGFIIDGEFDFVGEGYLEDFKSTGVWSYIKGNKDEDYSLQGSIYRWLAPHIITRDFMKIQNIFTDWSKLDAQIKKKAGYPQSRIVTKKLELLSIQETESFIRNKITQIKAHQNTPEPELPLCAPEDLWQSPPAFKWFSKPENKRCQKSFDNYAEAHNHMQKSGKGVIKESPGQVRRCGYCDGFELCTQKDTYLQNGTLVLP